MVSHRERVLEFLDVEGVSSHLDIAKYIKVPIPQVSSILARLRKLGLVSLAFRCHYEITGDGIDCLKNLKNQG